MIGSTSRTDTTDLSPAAQEALDFLRQHLRVVLETKERIGDIYSAPSTEVQITASLLLDGEVIDSSDAWFSIPRE